MFMENLKKFYMEKYDMSSIDAKYNMFFDKIHHNQVVGIKLSNTIADSNFYLFDCKDKDSLNMNPIAQIKFQLLEDGTVFIRRLEFINNNYKGKGYASKLISLFEKFCIKNGYEKILGEFDPLHGESEETVKNFYLRNNYEFKNISNKLHIYKLLKQNINNENLEF